jgi:hypothetical protein
MRATAVGPGPSKDLEPFDGSGLPAPQPRDAQRQTVRPSDTTLQTSEIRRTALRHALLSYVFGVGIIATTINHVPGVGNERSEVGVQASRRRRLIAAATSTAAA